MYTFQFQPQTVNFEVIDRRIFAEVLYPKDIYDLIDHHIRECVKREVRMRVCKNCLRYFAVTGKASTEYCDRVCEKEKRGLRQRHDHTGGFLPLAEGVLGKIKTSG